MINSHPPEEITDTIHGRVDEIVAGGPRGALALAGVATAIVIAMWFAFYLFIFLPRGALQ